MDINKEQFKGVHEAVVKFNKALGDMGYSKNIVGVVVHKGKQGHASYSFGGYPTPHTLGDIASDIILLNKAMTNSIKWE